MSTYRSTLPQVFPHSIIDTPYKVNLYVNALLDSRVRSDVPNGSSFAVTVDPGDNWCLWLSEASIQFLKNFFSETGGS